MTKLAELSLRSYLEGDSGARARFVGELFEGLRETGFVILKDHSIDRARLREAYGAVERLFALPADRKSKYQGEANPYSLRYTPFGREHGKTSTLPDLKEFWHVGREVPADHRLASFFRGRGWPPELTEFREVLQGLFRALDDAGRAMLSALCEPLEVDAQYFDRMTDCGQSTLRVLHYPPIPDGVDPGCVRAAAHEDINLITLLVSASSSGLELKTRDGRWLPIETSPDNIIVDAGDMLARITNDVIPATTHRVVNPAGPNVSRYSMPFFMHPNPDAVLTCLPSCRGTGPRYPDITGHDFLMERLREIGLTK